MNVLKKLYCRAFQAGFKLAFPFLPYREPEILKNVSEIADKIVELKLNNALLVTDGFLKKSGMTDGIENALKAKGIKCAVYSGTQPNPTVENIEECLKIYKAEKCQCLIAFGGGSSMDCAKATGARAVYPKRSVKSLGGNLRIYRKLPPLFAVPTTAGTGSEVTVTAVVTDSVQKHKYTMNSFPLIPAYAVLDPEVTYSLPKSLTASTGMDALTHAVEAYIGRATTKETRRLSKEAVKLIFENIETAYNDGTDRKARENMLLAAYKAGIAFSKSYVGYIHAVAHSLSGQYNTPHGLANAVLLPVVLKDYGECIYKKLHELGICAGVSDSSDSDEVGAKKFIKAIFEKNEKLGIPKTISGINECDIPKMSKYADKEGNPLYPVPKLMNAKELEKYYYAVMEK